jgi:serine/threonine protein kinase
MPSKVGRYRVLREVGRGGMGAVYLAYDPFIDRQVAVKATLWTEASRLADTQAQDAFYNEARAAGVLEHPNIVSLYDATTEDDRFYLVMEFVDGSTLQPFVHPGSLLPLERVVKIASVCATALSYAHTHGVVHGDVKPTNILISTQGEIKLSDFGNALLLNQRGTQTSSGSGRSLLYASPEQVRQESLTPASDQFSLGVVLYELLTGVQPFRADTEVGVAFLITNEDPPPLKNFRQDVPESLARILFRTLKKDPRDRFPNCLEMASELSAAFGHLRFVDEEINFQEKFGAIKKLSFFKDFSSSELIEVLKNTEWVHHQAGETIIREGDRDEAFYIVLSGEVRVEKTGREVGLLKRGACFGEMAYLGRITRTATVRAAANTALMKIRPSFIEQSSLATQLRFARVFIQNLIGRLARTTELAAQADRRDPGGA